MRRVNVLFNVLGFISFFIIIFLLKNDKHLNIFDYIVFSIAIIIAIVAAFSFYTFNNEVIKMRFLFHTEKYEIKNIVLVKDLRDGSYLFKTKEEKLKSLHINFIFQNKLKNELFKLIKKKNPDCKFILL